MTTGFDPTWTSSGVRVPEDTTYFIKELKTLLYNLEDEYILLIGF